MDWLRKLWESIVYAGLKSGSTYPPHSSGPLLGEFRERVERFLAGGAPSDPLYLTNRSFVQKARTAIIVTVACLIVVGLVGLGVGHYFRVRERPVHQPTAAEIARATLPDVVRSAQISTDHDVEVAEAGIQHGARTMLVGTLKNNATYPIENIRVVFNLTSDIGAKLGAVAAHVDRVDAKSTAPFSTEVPQKDAAFALVREIVHR